VQENPVAAGKAGKFHENNGRDRWLGLDEEAALLEHCDQRLRTFVLAAEDRTAVFGWVSCSRCAVRTWIFNGER